MAASLPEVQILGALRVARSDGVVPAGGPKERTALCLLALRIGHPVTTDELVEAIWANDGTTRSVNTLYVYLSNLRHTLGDRHAIVSGSHGYVLDPKRVSTDLVCFDASLVSGQRAHASGDAAKAVDALRSALALCRGQVGADVTDCEPVVVARASFHERRIAALELLFASEVALGNHGSILHELEGVVRDEPFREQFWALLMEAHYRAGNQAEALRTYQRARATLADELGLDPGRALRDLERSIIQQTLDVPTPLPASSMLVWLDAAGDQHRVELTPRTSPVRLGRGSENEVSIDWDRRVSRYHAEIVWHATGWRLTDLESANGTHLNGDRVEQANLSDGDFVRIGDVVVLIRLAGTPKPRERGLHDEVTVPASGFGD